MSRALIAVMLFTTFARAAESVKTLDIGAAAPDFALKGVDDKTWTLTDFKEAKVLFVIFTTNHCPTAQAYEDRLLKLHADYKNKGVAVVAISPNYPQAVRLDELGYSDVSDDLESMKLRAKEKGFAFPYLFDGETQKTSREYGCQATPHVFIFDQERKLRYTGRIDDGEVKEPTSHDARNAIDALLAGKAPPVEKTKVFGCSTKWADKAGDSAKSIAKWDAEAVELADIDLEGVKKLMANEKKKTLVINFWATWCAPCTRELPEFVTMNRMYRKRDFQLVTISLDEKENRAKAHEKLKELKVAATNYIFTGDRDKMMAMIDAKWEGPIPHTIIIGPDGKIVYRQTGEIDALAVKRAIVGQIGRTYASDKK